MISLSVWMASVSVLTLLFSVCLTFKVVVFLGAWAAFVPFFFGSALTNDVVLSGSVLAKAVLLAGSVLTKAVLLVVGSDFANVVLLAGWESEVLFTGSLLNVVLLTG